eukprot:m.135101 g.135101  ORF g.135101 m.135101 type:complete len:1475 (+) comp14708_c0_seq3:5366-9790(+)
MTMFIVLWVTASVVGEIDYESPTAPAFVTKEQIYQIDCATHCSPKINPIYEGPLNIVSNLSATDIIPLGVKRINGDLIILGCSEEKGGYDLSENNLFPSCVVPPSISEFQLKLALSELEHVEGNIVISLTSFRTLDFLSSLKTINGSLVLVGNQLETLQGLENLKEIHDCLIIRETNLLSLSALSKLKEVGNNFLIKDSLKVQNLDGLQTLERVEGCFSISRYLALKEARLPQLSSVGTVRSRCAFLPVFNTAGLQKVFIEIASRDLANCRANMLHIDTPKETLSNVDVYLPKLNNSKVCEPGTWLNESIQNLSLGSSCVPCKNGTTFMPEENHRNPFCKQVTECSVVDSIAAEPTLSSDRKCETCNTQIQSNISQCEAVCPAFMVQTKEKCQDSAWLCVSQNETISGSQCASNVNDLACIQIPVAPSRSSRSRSHDDEENQICVKVSGKVNDILMRFWMKQSSNFRLNLTNIYVQGKWARTSLNQIPENSIGLFEPDKRFGGGILEVIPRYKTGLEIDFFSDAKCQNSFELMFAGSAQPMEISAEGPMAKPGSEFVGCHKANWKLNDNDISLVELREIASDAGAVDVSLLGYAFVFSHDCVGNSCDTYDEYTNNSVMSEPSPHTLSISCASHVSFVRYNEEYYKIFERLSSGGMLSLQQHIVGSVGRLPYTYLPGYGDCPSIQTGLYLRDINAPALVHSDDDSGKEDPLENTTSLVTIQSIQDVNRIWALENELETEADQLMGHAEITFVAEDLLGNTDSCTIHFRTFHSTSIVDEVIHLDVNETFTFARDLETNLTLFFGNINAVYFKAKVESTFEGFWVINPEHGLLVIIPSLSGNFTFEIVAVDQNGAEALAARLSLHVTDLPQLLVQNFTRRACSFGRTVNSTVANEKTDSFLPQLAVSRIKIPIGESLSLCPISTLTLQNDTYNIDDEQFQDRYTFSITTSDSLKILNVLNVLVNPSNGYIIGSFGNETVEGNISVSLSDISGSSVYFHQIMVFVVDRDTDIAEYGPNGLGCKNGKPVDVEEFDESYTCDCSGTIYSGDNCEVSNQVLPKEDEQDVINNVVIILVVIVVVLAVLMALLAYRYKQKTPFNFQHTLLDVQNELGIAKADADGPDELKRKNVLVLGIIGHGEFGVVNKAMLQKSNKHSSLDDRVVAVKCLNNTDLRDTFLREIAVMTLAGAHPNIVSLIGVVTSDNKPMLLVIEYCEFGSLKDMFNNKTRIQVSASKIALDVCLGMQHLHAKKIIHRDLAARNLLVDTNWVTKISDFGLSRKSDSSNSTYYRSTNGLFPLRWTAPEAVNTLLFDSTTDVWSFGVVLVEIYTYGETPYVHYDNTELLKKLSEGYRHPKPSNCPNEVYFLILNCWDETPWKRPKFSELAQFFKARVDADLDFELSSISHPIHSIDFKDSGGFYSVTPATSSNRFRKSNGTSDSEDTNNYPPFVHMCKSKLISKVVDNHLYTVDQPSHTTSSIV